MNNKILNIIVFVLFIFLGIIACKTKKVITNKDVPIIVQTDTIMAARWYLSNRMPSCDSATIYMNSILSKDTVFLNEQGLLDQWTVVDARFGIHGDITKDMYNTNKYLYYINKNCFIGKSSNIVFNTFCPKSSFGLLKKLDRIHIGTHKKWYLLEMSKNNFGFKFAFENGIVQDVNIRVSDNSSLNNHK